MKRLLILAIILCAFPAFSGSAWSLTIQSGSIDVGDPDTFLSSADLPNSGFATELAWVQSLVGSSATINEITITSGGVNWLETNQAGTWAFEFKTVNPEFFYIKTGVGPGNDDHFLFQNVASLAWGVVALSGNGYEIRNVGAISHIGEVKGQLRVPEPATLLLLGLGLVGLARGIRRKT